MSVTNEQILHLAERAIETQRSHPLQGIALADEALALAGARNFEEGLAKAYRARALSYYTKGNFESALADYRQGLNRSRELHDLTLEAQCLYGIAMTHFFRTEYALALEKIYDAYLLGISLGRDENLAITLNGLTSIHGTLGNYPEATACNIQAYEILQSVENTQATHVNLSHRAILKAEMGDYEGAAIVYEESIEVAEKMVPHLNVTGAVGSYATILLHLGRYDEAVVAAEKGLLLAQELGNPYRIAQAHQYRAKVQERLGHFDEVDTIYQMLWHAIEQGEADAHAPGILVEIGAYYVRHGKYPIARTVLNHALNLLDNPGEIKVNCECHRLLSQLSGVDGNFEAALEHYQEFHRLHETLQKQTAENLIVAQTSKLEVERSQQAAEIDRLKNIELVEVNRQKTELLERLEKQTVLLSRLATIDPLTGLYNRRHFHDCLEKELGQVQESGIPLAVLIADLDNFKQINDRFSHAVGDIVLKTVANLFRQGFRSTDVIARYGGEEFVVLLPGTSATQTAPIADRTRCLIESYPWKEVHPELVVTTSIGVADERIENADRLLALADKRLYEAKRSGKNRVVYVLKGA